MLTNPQMSAMIAVQQLESYAKTQGCTTIEAAKELGQTKELKVGEPLLKNYKIKTSKGHQSIAAARTTADRYLKEGNDQTFTHELGKTNPYVVSAFKKK